MLLISAIIIINIAIVLSPIFLLQLLNIIITYYHDAVTVVAQLIVAVTINHT